MGNVLITGGAGFIGYHLASYLLARGHRIDLVDNFSRGVHDQSLDALSSQDGIRLINLDLSDKSALAELDTGYRLIFHLAAIVGVQHVLKAPYDVLSANVELLQNMLLFAKRQAALERFVFTSTSEVYAGTLKHFSMPIPTPETTPLALDELSNKRTSYMLSKIYGEALCLHSGLPVTIVRPHNFYGPRMGLSHVIPELLQKAYTTSGDTLPVFSADHRRTFCYIDDAVAMISALALARASLGQTFNVGNQAPEVSMRELAGIILSVTGKDLKIDPQPATPGSPPRRCPDMTRTFGTIDYRPRIDLLTGVRRTFAWYKDNVFANQGTSAV